MLNMGIIGFGKMGMKHADLICCTPGLKLIAVSKKSKTRLEQIKDKYNVDVYTDNKDLLDIKDIDYVIISTTNETHEDLTIEAFRKGKNVIVEKPMSLDSKGAERMVKEAEKYGKKLFVYYSTLWDRDFLLVKNTIDSGILGKTLCFQSRWMLYGEYWAGDGIHGMENPWRIKAESGGGVLMDLGIHMIMQLLSIFKKDPVGVYGILQSALWATEVDDHFFAAIRYSDNMICQLEASNNCMIPLPRWYVIGTKGTLEINGSEKEMFNKAVLEFVNEAGNRQKQEIELIDYPGAGYSSGFYADFTKYIKGEKKDFISMYDAAKSMKILDAIKESDNKKKFIEII